MLRSQVAEVVVLYNKGEFMKLAAYLLDKMKELGVRGVIAGGYARDKYHLKQPKDVDIIIMSNDEEKVKELLDKNNFIATPTYEGGDVRIVSVWQSSVCEELPIDVIVYNSELYKDPEDVVIRGFDVNMNQFLMMADRPIGIAANHDKVVRYINNDISDERRSKLIEKAKELGWDYSCLEKTIQ